jgi:hypothetical protein
MSSRESTICRLWISKKPQGAAQKSTNPAERLNLTHNLKGDYLSAKIKNRKGEEGEKVLKEGLKKGKTAQKRAMIGLKTYILLHLYG